MDTAVQAGVNYVSSIYFSLSHAKSVAVKNDLLKQAVTNAKSKADIAASALGLNVIGVKSINIESTNGFPPSPPEPLMARDKTHLREDVSKFREFKILCKRLRCEDG
jgi:uncharacterized protein YggE